MLRKRSLPFLSAVVGGSAALAAFLTVYEMRQDRIERNQPLILVDLVFTHQGVTWLAIKNIGTGIACDVSFRFDPVPVDYAGTRITDLSLFQDSLPVMSAGAEYRQIFLVPGYFQKFESEPHQFTVFAYYRGEGGANYERSYRFDLDRFRELNLPRPTTAESAEKLVRLLERAIDKRIV